VINASQSALLFAVKLAMEAHMARIYRLAASLRFLFEDFEALMLPFDQLKSFQPKKLATMMTTAPL
jgi:hypothetical protein